MGISAAEERAYYDGYYAHFLTLPDHAIRVDANSMRRSFNDPAQTQYERRRLYLAALDIVQREALAGRRVLDYGCGPGEWGVLMATLGADSTLLDLSSAAVELGMRRARASGVEDRVRGIARDASDLSCFADGEFDFVFANAALHHTIKYPNALEELVRVIRPGGRLLLVETLGNNPLLNLARRVRANLQHEAAELGEEVILSEREIKILSRHFRELSVEPLNLLAMAKRFFRGRFESPAVRFAVRSLEGLDSALLSIPALRRYCGEVIIRAVK